MNSLTSAIFTVIMFLLLGAQIESINAYKCDGWGSNTSKELECRRDYDDGIEGHLYSVNLFAVLMAVGGFGVGFLADKKD